MESGLEKKIETDLGTFRFARGNGPLWSNNLCWRMHVNAGIAQIELQVFADEPSPQLVAKMQGFLAKIDMHVSDALKLVRSAEDKHLYPGEIELEAVTFFTDNEYPDIVLLFYLRERFDMVLAVEYHESTIHHHEAYER